MLTDAKARRIKPTDGAILDGTVPGLYLFPSTKTGSGKWILRFTSPTTRKRRDMGIGNYPDVTIAEVRVRALAARQQLKAGIDPIESRRTAAALDEAVVHAPSFEDAARATHAEIRPAFKNAKHADQWINTLDDYVFPKLGQRKVDDLRAVDFADVLRPIWLTKPETASRVKQRCDRVMEWCAARGHVVASPVRVVDSLLPKQPGKRERVTHHPAMPWRDIPAFFNSELKNKPPTPSRQMLELLILTATRSGEVREMRWNEIDLEKAIWTIPAARMKAKIAHRVPLPSRCIELLQSLPKSDDPSALVFASRRGTPLSDMALTKLLRDTNAHSDVEGRIATAHGFRSSFRDWASENGYSRDLAERALAHTIKNSSEAAYHRTDLLEQRRPMMLEWERYCLNLRSP